MEPNVRPSDQLLIVGQNGSGKSVLAEYLFSQVQTQKVFVDVKADDAVVRRLRASCGEDEFSFAHGDVSKLDFKCRVLVYRPLKVSDAKEWNRLYAALNRRRNITAWLDEAFGPTTANNVPDELGIYLQHGRSANRRHIACTQRPVNIAKALVTEAHHIILYPKGFSAHDTKNIAREMGLTEARLQAIAQHVTGRPWEFGSYPHIWYEKRKVLIHRRASVPAA